MTVLDAVFTILKEAKEPLHYIDITKRVLDQKLWKPEGKTPEHTVNAQLVVDINKKGTQSKFRRYGPGIYGLADAGRTVPATVAKETLSFTDAAEQVLLEYSDNKPMHYREITKKLSRSISSKQRGGLPRTRCTPKFFTISGGIRSGGMSRGLRCSGTGNSALRNGTIAGLHTRSRNTTMRQKPTPRASPGNGTGRI